MGKQLSCHFRRLHLSGSPFVSAALAIGATVRRACWRSNSVTPKASLWSHDQVVAGILRDLTVAAHCLISQLLLKSRRRGATFARAASCCSSIARAAPPRLSGPFPRAESCSSPRWSSPCCSPPFGDAVDPALAGRSRPRIRPVRLRRRTLPARHASLASAPVPSGRRRDRGRHRRLQGLFAAVLFRSVRPAARRAIDKVPIELRPKSS